jgi:hypothetical protein
MQLIKMRDLEVGYRYYAHELPCAAFNLPYIEEFVKNKTILADDDDRYAFDIYVTETNERTGTCIVYELLEYKLA